MMMKVDTHADTPQDPQPVHFSTGVTLFIMAALLCLCVYAVCIDRKEKGWC